MTDNKLYAVQEKTTDTKDIRSGEILFYEFENTIAIFSSRIQAEQYLLVHQYTEDEWDDIKCECVPKPRLSIKEFVLDDNTAKTIPEIIYSIYGLK